MSLISTTRPANSFPRPSLRDILNPAFPPSDEAPNVVVVAVVAEDAAVAEVDAVPPPL